MQGDAASMEAPMRSTIMDSNSFKPSDLDGLDPQTRELVERRRVLGPSYRLFYKHPLHFVKGLGTRLYTADGEEYLDAYNNVVSVGHCHPHVVEAICRQVSTLNTHTRYLHEGIVDYAEHLVALLPPEVDRVMFECSGSEANDLAVRVARAATGGTGVIVTSEAYHGNTALITGLSPSIGADQPMLPDMRMIPSPDTWRLGTNDLGAWMAARVAEQIADMRRHGFKFAALLVDSIFSSDGVYPGAPSSPEAREGFLKPVVDLVHKEGGLFIADEVQPGFARTGEAFWGFERHGVVPDIVTMGKPMANGMPCSAMAARHEVLEGVLLADALLQHVCRQPGEHGGGTGSARGTARRAYPAKRPGNRTFVQKRPHRCGKTSPLSGRCARGGLLHRSRCRKARHEGTRLRACRRLHRGHARTPRPDLAVRAHRQHLEDSPAFGVQPQRRRHLYGRP